MSPDPTVVVSATAKREVLPDSFDIVARLSVSRPDSEEAVASLVRGYALLEQAAAEFPATVDVRPGAMSTWPDNGKKPTWHAERTTTITGTDLTTVGRIVSALTALPALAVDGPHWRLRRDNPAHGELQAEAVHEARARAERYAAALGGTLGTIIELSDPSSGARAYARSSTVDRMGGAEPAHLDLTPQPISLSATVNARWALVLPG